jgi:hypothetical protein
LLLLSLLGSDRLNRGVLVLGSDLDGSLGLWPGGQQGSYSRFRKKRNVLDEVDGIGQRLGRSLSSLGVVRLHADGQRGSLD